MELQIRAPEDRFFISNFFFKKLIQKYSFLRPIYFMTKKLLLKENLIDVASGEGISSGSL